MRRIALMFVIFLLLMSLVPLTFAQDGNSRSGYGDDIPEENPDDKDEKEEGVNSVAKRIANKDVRDVNKRLLELPDYVQKLKRDNVAEKAQIVREEATQIREKLSKCIDNEEENCKALRSEVKLRVKRSLARITEKTLNVLNKLKERVNNSDIVDKDAALEKINAAIVNLEEAKANVLALTNESSREEVKNAITELKNALKEAKETVREYFSKAQVNARRLQNSINKFNKLIENIGNRLDRFEERGYDFSDLKSKLDEVNEKVVSAQSKLDDKDNVGALNDLKEAHILLLEVLKEFRADLPKDDADDEGEDGVEDDEEETDEEGNETEDDENSEDETEDEEDDDTNEEGSDDEEEDDEE